jgi:hypothetical protein
MAKTIGTIELLGTVTINFLKPCRLGNGDLYMTFLFRVFESDSGGAKFLTSAPPSKREEDYGFFSPSMWMVPLLPAIGGLSGPSEC